MRRLTYMNKLINLLVQEYNYRIENATYIVFRSGIKTMTEEEYSNILSKPYKEVLETILANDNSY